MLGGTCQLCADSGGRVAKTIRYKAKIFPPIDITCVLPDLRLELCDAAFGSIHPCRELVFFNQSLSEVVDQPLQCLLQLDTLRFESLRVLEGLVYLVEAASSFSSF